MKYKNKKQYRLPRFDYSAGGYYFVTICSKDRKCSFGKIPDGKMRLYTIGRIAEKCWLAISEHFGYVWLDEFIIMPNHIHGIIVIDDRKKEFMDPSKTIEKGLSRSVRRNAPWRVPTGKNGLRPLAKGSLSSIVNHFKGVVKHECNKLGLNFNWQSRFYDRIIRNEESLDKIREYIRINPAK